VKPAKPAAPRKVVPRAARRRAVQPEVDGYACPVRGPHHFSDDWGDARTGHRHQGNDILAPYGTPIVAVISGVIKTDYSSAGGISLYLRGSDGNEYFYAHNSRNVAVTGQHVATGEVIAYVGNTGNARGGPSHVHFERHPGGGRAVDPYPFLSRIC
jgi:murein DD-endopeptidase MepM/ murein hydrolase activator NlpD